jgi:hypothetical protein
MLWTCVSLKLGEKRQKVVLCGILDPRRIEDLPDERRIELNLLCSPPVKVVASLSSSDVPWGLLFVLSLVEGMGFSRIPEASQGHKEDALDKLSVPR